MCACAKLYPTLCDPTTLARQALLCMGFSRQERWSGLPYPPPGDLPDPGINSGIEPKFPALQADSLPSESPWKPIFMTGARYRGVDLMNE